MMPASASRCSLTASLHDGLLLRLAAPEPTARSRHRVGLTKAIGSRAMEAALVLTRRRADVVRGGGRSHECNRINVRKGCNQGRTAACPGYECEGGTTPLPTSMVKTMMVRGIAWQLIAVFEAGGSGSGNKPLKIHCFEDLIGFTLIEMCYNILCRWSSEKICAQCMAHHGP